MNEQLLRFDKKQKYLILDTETEGLNLIKSRPWQVAWITAQGNNVIDKFNMHLHWSDLDISEDAARITGFKRAQHDKVSKDPKEVFDVFKKYLYDPSYKIVGQNLLGFDVYMINVWMKAMGLNSDYSYMDRIIDTLSLAKAIELQDEPDLKNFIYWQYRWLNYRKRGLKASQGALLKKYNIEHDPSKLHDALYDIEMNYKIFRKQLFDIEI